ncbi:DNA polymerase III [Thermotoga sp. Ku-13t]|uniref:PolC-type DNA polymerase III n=1 Tax=Thermotoga sp. Ku-13t TaxID=1755813 RepID=UPI0013EC7ACA|nr:PolC-type DNA polymerase III [Thermotoga sp. Ku-13t]KAF2957308.1 DNA polymerase III [Thermotoga sp. Ku-13t]
MKRVFVESPKTDLKQIAESLGVSLEESCTVHGVTFDAITNTLLIRVDKQFSRYQALCERLSQELGAHVVFQFMEATIELEKLRKELNGSFPYVHDVVVFQDRVILKVTGDFGRERINGKLSDVSKKIEALTGVKRPIEIEVVQPPMEIVEQPVVVVEEKPKKKRKTLKFHTPSNLPTESGKVKVEGIVFKTDLREGKKRILFVYITDKLDSLMCVLTNSNIDKFLATVQEQDRVLFDGTLKFDESGEPTLYVDEFEKLENHDRTDEAPQKRVELHAHSKFSDLDSVLDIEAYVKTAARWGWKAIALTDHGVVQGIPQFFEMCKNYGIKPIFGIEAYIVNDAEPIVLNGEDVDVQSSRYVVVDLETTGLHPMFNEIIEIGAVVIENGEIVQEFHRLIRPKEKLDSFTVQFTGITDEMLQDQPPIEEVLNEFLKFCENSVLVAHNANFDYRFLRYYVEKFCGVQWTLPVVDTLALAKRLVRLSSYNLEKLVSHFKIGAFKHHRALEDAKVTAKVFLELLKILKEKGMASFKKIESSHKEALVTQSKPFHATILVQNREGLKNLYKLVSNAHVKYFHSVPRIPKSELQTMRAGLLIGSACVAGELVQEILSGANEEEIEEVASFYDFIEIMPLDLLPTINDLGLSREKLKQVYRRLYEIGEKLKIPVVMTGDVHFLDPEDEKVRKVLMAPQSETIQEQPNACLRTTKEMMQAALEILEDETKAHNVAVRYPNQIADSIEFIVPLEKKLHTPKIEGAEEQIKNLTMRRAIEIYGDPLPEPVQKRIDKELNAIINHGYAVLYLIAKKMVDKSLSDGYVVGSRGSVGSSLVAHLLGITEVNPLPPHYYCRECHYIEFDESGRYGSGFDLPRKNCPRCGKPLERNGQDIPFETFMGFEGDKVPDIDLNFSGEYQDEAHRFVEELFGKNYVYRAGTINTIASRTAYGFVRAFEEKLGRKVRKAEMERLAAAITGVKRTTGQHPGGLMIIPKEFEVYDFTPVQYPANTKEAKVFTTHFDYESIHDDLVKIDALGHDDPTFIKILKDLTGINPMNVPMDDEKTLKIFSSLEPLGIKPQDLDNRTDVGTLGIPEFGTQFVRGMLTETRPKSFADLVRISGLSHGTDVWLNNARDWIEQGKATLSEVIACRDDIMNYLIKMGMNASRAFKIMENVRKGKGLSEEDEKLMRELGVPEWYIESCKRIKYLFPKAHAAAYVSMAFRIAYFKVHHPLAFYAAFFTLKGEEFDIDAALHGPELVRKKLAELSTLSEKDVRDKAAETTLEVMLEMFARGFSFLPPNINKSHAKLFLIEGKKLRIPFNKLPNLGDNAAESIVKARNDKPFSSLEDILKRTKLNKAHLDIFRKYVELEGLPEKEQISLF